ncbi:D-2-hydroxyacid dehydrogenase [Clostridium sp. 'White wine YQ']|uniref:D-2-hydroxyacid dehydrogenase n=1 Tax=Clostridium sp. 'White wine YQ' TaxID=3027474 RepID=UPI002364FFA3|nr:D-2-hydroxyacid dehydrogenase [Clostridium sp. 'White wine YQ']MDD7793113.1 D-2-hydroxyacid dehydrogenase [Clostridium sp. 'White wine YQ']
MRSIVILDGRTMGNVNFELLKEFGDVKYYDITPSELVAERVKDANVILTNKVVLNESNLSGNTKLELICEMATGYNNIDVEYAKERNIAVTNVAGYSTNTVAQHTFATLLHIYDEIAYYDNYVKSGEYSKSPIFTNLDKEYNDISGKTWGIVGLGAIGRKVAQIAVAFGANVQYYSTSGQNNNSDYKRVELDELLRTSDILSIHSPLNDKTQGLMNYDNISKMKKNAVLINMGRGPIVVDEDLARALDEDIIKAAALDVFKVEPINEDNPLLKIKNKQKLVVTPHIAWASLESRERLFSNLIDNIKAFYAGENKNRIV